MILQEEQLDYLDDPEKYGAFINNLRQTFALLSIFTILFIFSVYMLLLTSLN